AAGTDSHSYVLLDDIPAAAPAETADMPELKWYQKIECIDGDQAVKNSGSEEAFRSVLKIFVDSVPVKNAELEGYYSDEDWIDYTIKVHALKSSLRLIGAETLAEEAQLLETAGKEGNAGYIRLHHDDLMKAYIELTDVLKAALGQETPDAADGTDAQADKPPADEYLMRSVYEELQGAAEAMDCDTIGEILKELDDYSIPETEAERFEKIRVCAGRFDYDGILEALK
ncbi:MAG: Hpt domain-containing protein, partial [Lachnospiraceae bacterium]|nr:Hpt domain-containing protein [Lachnospiraceae bacterium]